MNDRFSNIGGAVGAILAKFLSISIMQIAEVALFAFIGSLIGEGVKILANWWTEKRKQQKK